MTSGSAEYSRQYDTYPSEEYPPDWQARRRKALQRDGYTCQMCGLKSTRVDDVWFDIDHIVPKSDGGGHELDNLQTLCPSCHAKKHPENINLRTRGRKFSQRNQPSLVVRFIWVVLGLFISSVGSDEQSVIDSEGRELLPRTIPEAEALATESGVTVEVTVTELWNSGSDSVKQMGRVQDAAFRHSRANADASDPAAARFVIWSGNDHPTLTKGRDYRFVGAKTNQFDGEFQLVVDAKTAVKRV